MPAGIFDKTILIGSSRQQLKLLSSAFKNYNGQECVCVESAATAIQLIEKSAKINLVLVDWLGMDMDIFEFLYRLRKISSTANSIVIVSGPSNTRINIRERLLSAGADYYMIKPYKPETLFRCIEALEPCSLCLPVATPWDARILRKMEELHIERTDVSYWYISSCLQQWLTADGIPQLKAVFIKVGHLYHVTDKAVESGIHRAICAIFQGRGSTDKVPTCKEWISEMANSIWFEKENENRGDDYAKRASST